MTTTMKLKWGLPGLVLLMATSAPVTAWADPFTFSDDFSPTASSEWSNAVGNWSATNGKYAAQTPNNNPTTYSDLPFDLANDNLQLTVTVNGIGDGGIWLDSDGTNKNGVLLVIGGENYGQGGRGGAAGTAAYWHVVTNGSISGAQGIVTGVFTPGSTETITVTVNGSTYTAYLDPDGVFDSHSSVLTTLTNSTFSNGEVGLYDDQPNKTTASGSGTPTSFSNFSLQGTIVPEPASLFLFGAGLAWLATRRRVSHLT